MILVYVTAGFLGQVSVLFPLCIFPDVMLLPHWFSLFRFCTTGYVPIGYEFGAELTYPHSESTSVGLLNAAGESIGIALVLGAGEVVQTYGNEITNYGFIGALVFGLLLSLFIKSKS